MPRRLLVRDAGAFLFYLALSVALLWPLALHLGTRLIDLGDAALNTWILDWVCYALTHAPLHLFDAPIFVPDKFPLAYSENLVGIAIFMLPLRLAGVNAVAAHNIATILGFATSGFGMYLLARSVTKSTAGALIAGIFFAFTSFRIDHLEHVQIVWSGWVPMILLALLAYWRRPSAMRAAGLALAFTFCGLSSIYFLLMTAFASAITILFLQALEPRRDVRFWAQLCGALALSALILLPFLIPYQVVSHLYSMRRYLAEVRGGSPSLGHWMRASQRNWLYGRPGVYSDSAERALFPGAIPIALTAVAAASAFRRRREPTSVSSNVISPRLLAALDITAITLLALSVGILATHLAGFTMDEGHFARVTALSIPMMAACIPMTLGLAAGIVRLMLRYPGRSGRSMRDSMRDSGVSVEMWGAAVWMVIGVSAAFGTNGFLVPFLFRIAAPFRAIRAPARWANVAYVGMGVWVAAGMAILLARTRHRKIVYALLVVATIVEVIPRPIDWFPVPPTEPVYRWLAANRPGTALELPMAGHGEQALYLLASTTHHQPIMNGASGWDGPTHKGLREKYAAGTMDQAFLDTIERAGCRIVIVHDSMLAEHREEVEVWLRDSVAGGRLRFLLRIGDDRVYVLEKTGVGHSGS